MMASIPRYHTKLNERIKNKNLVKTLNPLVITLVKPKGFYLGSQKPFGFYPCKTKPKGLGFLQGFCFFYKNLVKTLKPFGNNVPEYWFKQTPLMGK
jgi:hypothetical protein